MIKKITKTAQKIFLILPEQTLCLFRYLSKDTIVQIITYNEKGNANLPKVLISNNLCHNSAKMPLGVKIILFNLNPNTWITYPKLKIYAISAAIPIIVKGEKKLAA